MEDVLLSFSVLSYISAHAVFSRFLTFLRLSGRSRSCAGDYGILAVKQKPQAACKDSIVLYHYLFDYKHIGINLFLLLDCSQPILL